MAITTITNAMVSVNAIQGTLIADNAITAVHIATNAVSGTLIADNAVTATHIAQNTITVTQLADDAVEADKIADGVITTNHLNKAMISSQTQVTAVAGDFLLIGDTSDSNNLKKIPISGITSLVSSFDADAAQTFNESGAAVDFRVEGDTEQNLLFVDGSADKVGIGTNSPSTLLHLGGTAPGDSIIRQDSTSSGTNWEIGERAAGKWQIFEDDNDSIVATFMSTGKVGIGTESPGQTLSVDASGGANFFVSRTGQTGGLYIESDGTNGVIRNPASNPILFQTNGANTRASVTNDGITFNGDTAAANALDDYEEGTWTPALVTTGGVTTTSSSMYGIYTKIGNICHIHCKISATLSSLPGQTFSISGLPFAAKDSSDSNQRAIMTIGGDTLNTGGNVVGKAHFRTNGSQLDGVYLNSGTTAYWTYNTMDSTTFELNVHGFYTTT